ncbi:MAG: MBL fold metallo-hydrolase [Actinomycetota bacterium]|nr:MBL fold metallo-hydrolase [Actinomycetota bacterium]
MRPIRVGDIVVHPVNDGTAVLLPENWANSDWTEHQHLLDADGRIQMPIGTFLARIGDRLVLLDAGVGVVSSEMFEGGLLLGNLAALGVQPGDIDTIVISHLHSDHMGWVERDGAPVFTNATVHIGAADWAHFVDNLGDGRRRASRLQAIESQVQLIDGDGVTILPGLTTRATPGHTPGHTSTVISSGDERLIVLGDAIHCPAQLTEVDWEFIYDVDPTLARRTRAALLQEAEMPGTALLPCHFPGLQAARLLPGAGTRRWVLSGE